LFLVVVTVAGWQRQMPLQIHRVSHEAALCTFGACKQSIFEDQGHLVPHHCEDALLARALQAEEDERVKQLLESGTPTSDQPDAAEQKMAAVAAEYRMWIESEVSPLSHFRGKSKEFMAEFELTFELDTLRGNEKKFKAERDALVRSLAEAENRLEVSKQNILMDNMEKEKRIRELTVEIYASRGNAKELTAGLDALREHNIALREHINDLVKSIKGDSEHMNDLVKSIQELTLELDTSRGNAKELTEELDAMREQNNALVKSLAEAENRLEDSKQNNLKDNMCNDKHIEELTLELGSLRHALSVELNVLHQNNLRKENCIKALTILSAQQQKIETVVATSQQDRKVKEKYINALTFEIDASRGNAKELTAGLEALSEQCNALVKFLGGAGVRLEEIKQTIIMKDNFINVLIDEKKEIQSVVDARQKECEMVLAISQQDKIEKEKRIWELTVEHQTFHQRMALMEAHVKEMKAIVDDQQQEIAMSMKDMKNAWTLNEKDVLKKEKMRTELIQELRAEAGALRQEMDIMVKHKISEVESLKAELEASNGEVQVVKKDHVKSQRACMDTRKMLEDKEALHAKV